MCAIFQLSLPANDRLLLKLSEKYGPDTAEKYRGTDIYPKNEAPVLGKDGDVSILKWGFPIKGKRSVVFNARSETLRSRPMFRDHVTDRCVVPATGFYEWGGTSGGRRKYFIKPADSDRFYLAAVWKRSPEDGGRSRFVIITTAPNRAMAAIHSRMPAVIEKADVAAFLRPQDASLELLKPYGGELLISDAR